jgi:hypothetical protein
MNKPKEFSAESILPRCKLPKYLTPKWETKLGWQYSFPWRTEQLEILLDFQNDTWNTFVIQAIFGGGKTTMILAMIFDLIVQKKTTCDRILVSAFNVAIKNEIKKKLKYVGKIVPRTVDSVVWHICKEMNYPTLKEPDFEEKRKYLYQNISNIPPDHSIDYIFLDEAQDLERQIHFILKKRFPHAKFVIVGDIFQSITKEPRESFLWSLLQEKGKFTYNMTNTPRVPNPILVEIKSALYNHYPEFQHTIQKWTSSNQETFEKGISWNSFSSYGNVFKEMEDFVKFHGCKNSMILVFSSAITVRGTLGDVSRVRRYFSQKNIPLNANHKQMNDDALFISTVNSSKGLERDHVFCFLTFPLEMAFSNFSSDILMNLVTVGLTRCKKSITFHVPEFVDRFSPLLQSYSKCPMPSKVNPNKKSEDEKKSLLEEDYFHLKPYLLQKDHSVTELLRLQILSYSLQKQLSNSAKKYNETNIPVSSIRPRTEEEATLLGLVFETLILSFWQKRWPTDLNQCNTIGHSLYETFVNSIRGTQREWINFQRNNPYHSCSSIVKIQGAILYARLHLAFFQKIICSLTPSLIPSIHRRWEQIKPFLTFITPNNIKTQDKAHYRFINGVIDMSCQQSENDLLEIIEIKASRQKDWLQQALLQAILYGLCKHKSIFRVHLINVLSKSWKHYYVSFPDMKKTLRSITDEIQLYNLNCFLCKNRSIANPNRKNFKFEHVLFLDGRYDQEMGWTSMCLFEFVSPTKVVLLRSFDSKELIENFWENEFLSFIKDLNVEKIIVSHLLWKTIIPFHDRVDYRFLHDGDSTTVESNWDLILDQCDWKKELEELPEELINTKLNWKHTMSSTSLQIAIFCTVFNFT